MAQSYHSWVPKSQAQTKINFSREAGCSLFLFIFTCLFRGTELTNRNFTRLLPRVQVLWSHQGVGISISQTSISSSLVVLALWDSRMKSCSWHSCSSTELKQNLRPESPMIPKPYCLWWLGHYMRWGGNSRLFVDCRMHNLSWAVCLTQALPAQLLPIFFHSCPCPFHPKERQVWLSVLTISINHEVKHRMRRFRAC